MTQPPAAPAYEQGTLANVLPSIAAALGVGGMPNTFGIPPARRAVVVLVDGLGDVLLSRRSGHAPFLRNLDRRRIVCGFPSTTATSMGSFGTGLLPGTHGLVGYTVLVPGADRVLNELSWEDGPDPHTWQPNQTVFERAERDGVAVTRIGPGYFDGSGLTMAALRGGRFTAARSLPDRVDATLAALRADRRSLVYLYWGDIDKLGHEHGCDSWQWSAELESVDAAIRRLVESVPADTAVVLTADHGMVDIPQDARIDLAHDPELAAGVRHVAGEARGLQLHCETGAHADVLATWRDRLGESAWVLSRQEAESARLFGLVEPAVRDRIGDVLVVMRERVAVVDSRTQRPELLRLIGQHGALTEDELAIPLIVVPPRNS
ncbi:alkaline phosphatase family protein [Gephyromycinifex aptenodytis]|uniref:alkaline phosphatase family protein n=1 Tax=Gephyromycinifex aptenodytis TaxID=2716227 RepID=UPI001445A091|nr:nucleotide pyrophosphatase/phosphodiesterase family protein [Gephyromycinifex aptenodytis]